MTRVRVPASASNLGAGFDCLGLALDVWLEAWIADGEGPNRYSGTLEGFDPADDLVREIVGPLQGRHLEVHSEIPVGRGLGSSAAAIVAGIALRRLRDGQPIDRDAIFRETVEWEGHPDNAGPAVFGGLVLSAHRPEPVHVSDALGIALAVPDSAVDTREARAMLPADFPREIAILQASSAASLVLGLTSGNGGLVGFGMDDHIAAPFRKRLIAGFDAAVEAGRAAGAFGVTISGSGSALVAIAERERTEAVAAAMADAFAAHGNPARPLTPAVSGKGFAIRES
jgi:homoserine kinase